MQEEDFDKELKVLVVGNGGVGKTSMIRRFCKGIFTDEYKKTIGVDFLEKNLYVDGLGQECRFMLWDTGARWGAGVVHGAQVDSPMACTAIRPNTISMPSLPCSMPMHACAGPASPFCPHDVLCKHAHTYENPSAILTV